MNCKYIPRSTLSRDLQLTLRTPAQKKINKILSLKVIGVLRGLPINTLFAYNDNWPFWTLIGQSDLFVLLSLSSRWSGDLLLFKAICLYCCPCPVIGQVTRDEWIAAFIKIFTVVNLYFFFPYPQKRFFTTNCLSQGTIQLFMFLCLIGIFIYLHI